MSSLASFLWARFDEDAAEIAKQPDGEGEPGGIGIWATGDTLSNTEYLIIGKTRALAEVEAKRALLADLLAEPHDVIPDEPFHSCRATVPPGELGDLEVGTCTCGRDKRVNRRLRRLALPYAGHPDYRLGWRP